MKILFSTTVGHNPGDEIIHAGVANLVKRGLKQDFEAIIYNRNPDLQLGYWREPIRDPIGNYMTSPVDLSFVDRVILSGSPEFFGPPMRGLYEALEHRPDIPVLALGVGLGDPAGQLDPLARKILGQAKIITRSNETIEFLKRDNVGSKALPCPALFASMYSSDPIHQETLFIVQRPGTCWHEVKESLLDGLEITDQLLCLHLKEYHYFKSKGFERVRYAASGADALRIIREYPRVVSTRLHGAIGALSLGVPSRVIADGDFRIETAARMYSDIMPVCKSAREARGYGAYFDPAREQVDDYKWNEWNEWVKALKEIW